MTMAVRTDRLGFAYARDAWALRDCSIDIPSGSVVGLVGSNGAGKSTLLSLLAGLMAPSAGRVLVGGVDPRLPAGDRTPTDRVRFVNQQRPLYGSMSPLQMLEFGRRTNRYWDGALARGWLDAFDVPVSRACRQLSGGQRTQVTLALALGARPAVLLLDEPLADLDAVVRTDVTGALLSLNASRGMTIMLSTHAITELSGVIDRLVLLEKGRVVLTGDVDDLRATHLTCVGPGDEAVPAAGTPVHVTRAERQTRAVVRISDAELPILGWSGWRTAPVALDEIVLAYLRSAVSQNRTARLQTALDIAGTDAGEEKGASAA